MVNVAPTDWSFHSSFSPAVAVTADDRNCRPATFFVSEFFSIGATVCVDAVSEATLFVSEFFLVGATVRVGAAGGVVTCVSGGA